MDHKDKMYALTGGGCILFGTMLTLLTNNSAWFAVGSIAGAVIVGIGLFNDDDAQPQMPIIQRNFMFEDRLGAPPIDIYDTRRAGEHRLLYQSETEGFPMRYRIPECTAYSLPIDPRGAEGIKDDIRRVW
jgi:hypothetical protein